MKYLLYASLAAVLMTSAAVFAGNGGQPVDPDADYDRLDGTGVSGKKVNVIEWEGNLEIHVYPKGSLRGLGLKVDRKDKNKPVMVISYRFDVSPTTPVIRRNILGIPMNDQFRVYRETSADDYDKIIISNNALSLGGDLVAYQLDPAPKQLYPDGHPALAQKPDSDTMPKRAPAAKDSEGAVVPVDEEGRIRPFEF